MRLFLTIFSFVVPLLVMSQSFPTVEPTGTYYKYDRDGAEETGDVNGTVQGAPVRVVFEANATGIDDLGTPRYEWKIWKSEDPSNIIVHRTEESLEYTFTESGTFVVQLYVTFYDASGQVYAEFPEEGGDSKAITFSVSESKLEFPNAFSPNNDGYNDTLRPKDGYQSIVSFDAAVFNRWGNKLYSWTDVNGEWDGKCNGKTVKDGVYFLVVKAKGADGRKFNIRKTITVLTGYNNGEGSNTGTNE